ncbi:MAG: glycoside hydrolase family 25 protein [Ruminococcus sp.]|nr:glycoside hydrolase family 25 protein [Ruminococcus sp.]
MKLFKAAAGAAAAFMICGAAAVTAYAEDTAYITEEAAVEAASVQGEYRADEDPGYYRYRQNVINGALGELSPAVQFSKKYQEAAAFSGSANLVHSEVYNGLTRSYGVDVSYYQPNTDWEKAKAAGVEFAIVRIGYRGYGKAGTLVYDDLFWSNVANAKKAGIKVGAYFYTQAITTAEAAAEAKFCMKALEGIDLDLPVYYDIESVDYAVGRLDSAGLTKKQKTELCRSFCDTMISGGYESGVYANAYWLNSMINGPELGEDYPIWLACYGTRPLYYSDYDVWQYSGTGTVSGFQGYVDLNVSYGVDHAPEGKPAAEVSISTVKWNAVEDADGYTLYKIDADGQTEYQSVDADTLSVTVPESQEGKYAVAAYSLYGGKKWYGPLSNTVSVESRIRNVVCERAGKNMVKVTWDGLTNAQSYEVYTDMTGSFRLWSKTDTNEAYIWGFDLENYKVKIRPLLVTGKLGYMCTPVQLPGNAPSGVSVLSADENFISWTPVADADGYELTGRYEDGGEFDVKLSSGDQLYAFVDGGITADYRVRAYLTLDGEDFFGGYSDALRVNASSGMEDVVLTSIGNELSWNDVEGAEGYVLLKTDKYGNTGVVSYLDKNSCTVQEQKDLTYSVKAYRVSGGRIVYGEESNKVAIRFAQPESLRTICSTPNYLVIGWDELNGCDGYDVYIDNGSGFVSYSRVNGNNVIIRRSAFDTSANVRVFGYKEGDIPAYGFAAELTVG